MRHPQHPLNPLRILSTRITPGKWQGVQGSEKLNTYTPPTPDDHFAIINRPENLIPAVQG